MNQQTTTHPTMAQNKKELTKDQKEELKLLEDSWIRVTQTYMNWFSWHFGIHVAAFAAFFATVSTLRVEIFPAAIFMIALDSLGIGAGIAMFRYDGFVRGRVAQISNDPDVTGLFCGGAVGRYARGATLATNVIVLCAWIFLLSVNPFGTQAKKSQPSLLHSVEIFPDRLPDAQNMAVVADSDTATVAATSRF